MLIDIHNFSIQTSLPFEGMDELVRIVLAPETLQSVIKMLQSIKRWNDSDESLAQALRFFNRFVVDSCKCLVFIEGETSVHSTDGIKLKNWWAKKYKQWLTEEEPIPEPEHVITPSISTATPMVKSNFLRQHALSFAIGTSAIVAVSILIARRLR